MRKIYFLLVLALAYHTEVQAQVFNNWQVDHIWDDGDTFYSFDALSSYGNIVTAGGNTYDTLNRKVHHILFHTSDAGVTWEIQDPGLPSTTYLPNKVVPRFMDIQQIDSLDAVAVGDSDVGPILRTADGGKTWVRQHCNNEGTIWHVHFSSPNVGMVWAPSRKIYTTIDGGNTWFLAPFRCENGSSPYSRGQEAGFSIFKRLHGPIYMSKDNWSTIDSTPPIYPDSINYNLFDCKYNQDTVIAYGTVTNFNINPLSGYRAGLFLRSFDRGQTWQKPFFLDQIKEIRFMTPINRDTILAAGWDRVPGFGNNIAISTDRGATWHTDTIVVRPPFNGACVRGKGIAFTSNGTAIAEFGPTDYAVLGIDSTLLIRAQPTRTKVELSGKIFYNHRIFPIPATKKLNIASVEDAMPFSMVDVFGRTVLKGQTLSHESKEIDVGELARGVYYVLVDYGGVRGKVVIGKVILVGQ
ncbi:MAG: T9SS type A sorting domain-containing protein [Ignavibacteriota bacterium]